MRPKLLLAFVMLVVVPTAVLSLLAVSALRNEERLLRRSTEMAAANAIADVARSVAARLAEDLDKARVAMTDCLVRGWDPDLARVAAARLIGETGSIEEVYVFMNPWGFLYPESRQVRSPDASEGVSLDTGTAGASDAQGTDSGSAVIVELRRQAALNEPSSPLAFDAEGDRYAFAALGGRKSLYVGCRYRAGVEGQLARSYARTYRGGLYRLYVETDRAVGGSPAGVRDEIASGHLHPPFDAVRVVALPDPGLARPVRGERAKLQVWGIVLLGFGVLAGAAIVLFDAVAQIRRAEERSQLVAGISHDLRTPVAAVHVLSESLALGRVPDPDRQRLFLQNILRETRRLGDLVDRVLFLVKFGQGGLRLESGPVSIADVIQRACASAGAGQLACPEQGASRLRVDVSEHLPAVAGDSTALEQAIVNLVDNALKYSRKSACASGRGEDGPAVTVRAGVTESFGIRGRRRWVKIDVEDRGMGLSPDELRRISRPYYRTARAREANLSGIGLGLSMVRSVVKMHGGRLAVSSE
ncbi:MAG: HAMP domain-containing histidine kinase, partial [Lentisphaerae bacterium]|nr:HAMP domain-containing histidine kinase [Lentisphaerota bacterium]